MQSTNIKNAYRLRLKEKILNAAHQLFCKYGIRRVKMDDIANKLRISKRTLYEIYQNKEKLLFEVVQRNEDLKYKKLQEIDTPGSTVIDIIIELYRQKTEELRKINPTFLEELHKYPHLLEYIKNKHERKRHILMEFVKRGINEGCFLPNINYEIAAQLTDAAGQFIMNNYLYKKYDFQEIFKTSILLYVRGICTPKGVQQLDNFLATL